MYLEVRKIQFTDLIQVAASDLPSNRGYFRFSIPASKRTKRTGDVLVSPVKIETMPSGDYTYIADLMTGQNGRGSLILTQEKGKRFGSIILEDRVFRIEQTEAGEQILIELNQKLLNSAVLCGTSEGGGVTKAFRQSNQKLNRNNCNSRIVRTLVLFTDRADNVSDPVQLATTLMNELATALSNSRIYSSNLRFQLVGTERIGFGETGNAVADLRDLVSDNDLNNRRQNARADLVVVLTDGNYLVTGGQILGIATLDEYSQPNDGFVAIVEADAGNVTFAHEVGHLMGCRHDNDNRTNVTNLSNTAKGHSWFYRNWFLGRKHYQKSVVASGTTQGSTVLYFSNPAVKAHPKARDNTGTPTRNNFAQLNIAASVVGCYDDFDDMIVSISGPSIAQPGESITLSASVANCASRTYLWEVSNDGFSYSFLGTGSSVSYNISPVYYNNNVYFRLTVTCSDGQVRTDFKYVSVQNDCTDPLEPCLELANGGKPAEPNLQQAKAGFHMYPNPTAETVKLVFEAPEKSRITVVAYSMLSGKSYRLYQGRANGVNNGLLIDVSKLEQGMYSIVIILDGAKSGSRRLIVQRQMP